MKIQSKRGSKDEGVKNVHLHRRSCVEPSAELRVRWDKSNFPSHSIMLKFSLDWSRGLAGIVAVCQEGEEGEREKKVFSRSFPIFRDIMSGLSAMANEIFIDYLCHLLSSFFISLSILWFTDFIALEIGLRKRNEEILSYCRQIIHWIKVINHQSSRL